MDGWFHPNGVEIILNHQVWDVRTFKLLRTVPTLDDGKVKISGSGDVIYVVPSNDTEEDYSFKTLDSSDYSTIGTISFKNRIDNFCINKNDTQLAFVETSFDGNTYVQLYDVGLRGNEEYLTD